MKLSVQPQGLSQICFSLLSNVCSLYMFFAPDRNGSFCLKIFVSKVLRKLRLSVDFTKLLQTIFTSKTTSVQLEQAHNKYKTVLPLMLWDNHLLERTCFSRQRKIYSNIAHMMLSLLLQIFRLHSLRFTLGISLNMTDILNQKIHTKG